MPSGYSQMTETLSRRLRLLKSFLEMRPLMACLPSVSSATAHAGVVDHHHAAGSACCLCEVVLSRLGFDVLSASS